MGPVRVKMARQLQGMVGGDFNLPAKTRQIGLLSHFQARRGSVETKSCNFQNIMMKRFSLLSFKL